VNTTREYLTAGELACHLRASKRTVWRCAAQGILPQPLRPSRRKSLWLASEVRQRIDVIARHREAS
jgi:predicted DNA-binding transcriptional regulator AlpA